MATILLSAAGAALGSSLGGSVLGLSMTAVGRFLGASLGRTLDQRLLGAGSESLETGKIDRFRLSGAGEGAPIAQVYGRMRLGGHVIWATEFKERVQETDGGGKGAPSQPTVRQFSYSVSLALAICEGEITGVNRVWADGAEVAVSDLNMRVYAGTLDQLPDPRIEAAEGVGMVPAYRGTAYVVLEDLQLERFGNRVPQFSFEVTRPDLAQDDMPALLQGVAMIPGTGEYSLATQPVYLADRQEAGDGPFASGPGGRAVANVGSPSEEPDFTTSLRQLADEAPNCAAASLIVSWFGDDLRCGQCRIRPKVEQSRYDAKGMPWSVAGLTRSQAESVPQQDGRPVYGGTPTDQSVIEAIQRMQADGLAVTYYPFILMDQMAGNGQPDPWSGAADQPVLPWRGRITLSVAPGRAGSPDVSAMADTEVASFFGTALAADFTISEGSFDYGGPQEWSYRRFILHQAALCAAAGGVDAFCIGSEMRGLTLVRGADGFPAVAQLKALATECRLLLGPMVKIGYAADWTEYFGYHPQDGSGDLYFHLDPLWSDPEIDFVGIDNYMPLSDWRDGEDHEDVSWRSIYSLDYLRANIEGGEGYDWFYATPADREAQVRTPISDGAYGEPWVWRYKDIRNWWANPHHERVGGTRKAQPTTWQPESKPIWFTELGCAAIDKGTNQPNKFIDPKSSESSLPYFSNGLRDDLVQRQYLRAQLTYWNDPEHNPASSVYGGTMLDLSRAFVWAWDARPYPWFPGNETLWSDGPNYRHGHWLNGRLSGRSLASVVGEICAKVGLTAIDTSHLHGIVRGYVVPQVTDARRALQPLMLAYGFDAIERDGVLVFQMRNAARPIDLARETLVDSDEIDGDLSEIRASEAEMAGRVRIHFLQADSDHQAASEEAILPDDATHAVSETDLPLALTRAEGRQIAERWLAEARVARDSVRFALPPSQLALGAGDIVRLPTVSGTTLARIDKVEVMDHQIVDAVRIEPDVFSPSEMSEEVARLRPVTPAVPVTPVFLDLPLMSGDEVPHAPHLALSAKPWPGAVALYDAAEASDYALNGISASQSVIGLTETPLCAARAGKIDRGLPLQVRLASGSLQSVSDAGLLTGANLMAIGDGSAGHWELFQFRDAALMSEGRWQLSHRLRGQAGSEGVMPDVWPVGSWVVLMNGAPSQIALKPTQRGLLRHYRVGLARRPYDHAAYEHLLRAFDGNGLRPFRPGQLRVAEADASQVPIDADVVSGHAADFKVTWIRQTRIDGDVWELAEVPIGEETELYRVQVRQGQNVVRDTTVSHPAWIYSISEQTEDGLVGPYRIAVAQVSHRFGPGPWAEVEVTA